LNFELGLSFCSANIAYAPSLIALLSLLALSTLALSVTWVTFPFAEGIFSTRFERWLAALGGASGFYYIDYCFKFVYWLYKYLFRIMFYPLVLNYCAIESFFFKAPELGR